MCNSIKISETKLRTRIDPIRSPCIIELIGPPGTGKSSLGKALQTRIDGLCVYKHPSTRSLKYVLFFAKNLILLAPQYLYLAYENYGKLLHPRNLAFLAIVKGWQSVLTKELLASGKIIVLDEGAFGIIARLFEFGSPLLKTKGMETWWKKIIIQWANTINLVIQLEAPGSILVHRIRTRHKYQYEMTEMSDEEVLQHLSQIQASQRKILATLHGLPARPEILCFNSAENSLEQICDEITDLIFISDSH